MLSWWSFKELLYVLMVECSWNFKYAHNIYEGGVSSILLLNELNYNEIFFKAFIGVFSVNIFEFSQQKGF